ncbi:DNA modification methylase [Desulfosporosinus acidiphilus SJ4]|uniref:Methyltransferase n=1 Tax=Desulfosporosinus acidiphilus (strain DSM 22704 / JCM 16185 / SJ4) TaxID=646529 RepID=I4D3E3_DESAJ|nr:site-specific DNA-methyltransferase [Desulfosporosinus acidiphilus]AFM40317.1 DNA modification methylase [Desulfosporosinus acidiphilus SJ4]
MDIQKIPAEKLNPAKYNPRKNLKPGDTDYEKLRRSIEEFGYVEPVIWNKQTGNIVGGHQRYKILTEQGVKDIDCVVVDMDEQHEKALNIALNKVAGEWDMPLLTDLLKDLDESGFEVSLTGFEAEELDELFGNSGTEGSQEVEEDDFDTDAAVAKIETPISQRGDIWQLGKHRLMCGDSTLSEDMAKLMDGQQCDLVLTDPPYNVDYQGATKDKLKIQNDKMEDDKFLAFLTDAFTQMYEHSKKGAAIYVFHADSEGYNFRAAFKHAGYTLRQCLVWVKNSMVLGRQDYQWRHEPILYGWKDGASHSWYSDRKQTTVVEFDKPHRNSTHPTIKPLGLVGYYIENSSKAGDLVLDPFSGSFSTGIACEQTHRICYGMEMDPKYVDVCASRYIEHKGGSDDVYLIRNGEKVAWKDIKQV